MSLNLSSTILVIVGITGDLAARKLLPAIEQIAAAGELPADFMVVGITRRDVAAHDVLANLKTKTYLANHLHMYKMDLEDAEAYKQLENYLATLEQKFNQPAQLMFYLSVPPQISQPIVRHLGEVGLTKRATTKLLLEKPFGSDLQSAQELVSHIDTYFDESKVYRIDHYLAKEMAQNLLVFRGSNSLFKRTWNKDFIERIEILAAESIGIEGRTTFYEQTGALRDLVQSHLLQLAALVLMQLPPEQNLREVPARRLAALQALQSPANVRRGQYTNYRQEVGNQYSTVETFVSLTLLSDDPNWQGVPIVLTTGKALYQKSTEIRIRYKQEDTSESNQLVLRIQPHEGIEVDLWSKRPGYARKLERVPLRFTYTEHFDALPEAYEQVLLDAIRSDHNLFTSSEEVLASWRILAPVQKVWDEKDDDLVFYEPGSKPEDI